MAAILLLLPEAQAADIVATNTELANASTATFPNGVWRADYAANRGAGPLLFTPQTGPCPVNDGGSCVNSSDGNSWKSNPGNVVNFLQFGADPTGRTSNTAIYDNFLAACGASRSKRCFVPPGVYSFTSQPGCIGSALTLFGAGTAASTELDRNYNGSGGTGLVCLVSGSSGAAVTGLAIYGGARYRGGSLVSVITTRNDAAGNIGEIRLADLRLTSHAGGDCASSYSLYVDGTFTTTEPFGIRSPHFENIQAFGAAIAPVYMAGVIGPTWVGGGIFNAGCAAGYTAGLVLNGTSAVNTTQGIFDIPEIGNGIALAYTTNTIIRSTLIGATGGVAIRNTGTDRNDIVITPAIPNGAAEANWTNSRLLPLGSLRVR